MKVKSEMVCKLIRWYLFLLCVFPHHLKPVDYGAPWVSQGHTVIRHKGNRIKPEAMMDLGFSLFDNTASCTFDSLFPVSGYILLNGGSLYLNRDLKMEGNFHLASGGYFYGNGHSMHVSKKSPFNVIGLDGVATMTTRGQATMGASVNYADWSYSSSYVAGCSANAAGDAEIKVYSFSRSSLSFKASAEIGADVNGIIVLYYRMTVVFNVAVILNYCIAVISHRSSQASNFLIKRCFRRQSLNCSTIH